MSGSPQILRVTPDKLIEFPLSLYTTLKAKLRLENTAPTPSFVGFKIKTTAPKSYLVRPSMGVIPPNGVQEIEIVLQPLSEAPSSGQDRFLVQATIVENEQQQLTSQYWQTLDKQLLYEQRMTVYFRKAEGVSGPDTEGAPVYTKSDANFVTGSSGGAAAGGAKKDYSGLLDYSIRLEKRNRELQQELEALGKQLESRQGRSGAGPNDSGSPAGSSRMMGLEFWHWFLIGLFVLVFLKLTDKI